MLNRRNLRYKLRLT